jgi:uncharacterized protein with PIN domain
MGRASFRFYAELNDFLPREQRGRPMTHDVDARSTLKDTIESLGVPHPEIDLLAVNGRIVDFGYRPRDGDRVAAYPRFWSIALDDRHRLAGAVPEPARFVTDVHLAQLTARLRLAGFDVVEASEDEEVARISERDARIALTRDRELLKRKCIRVGRWIRHGDPDEQFVEVLGRFDLVPHVKPFTRCLRCNAILEPVAGADVADRIPPGIPPLFRDFHTCPVCRRVYWRGSHYDRLRRRLQEALERAAAR